MLSLMIVRASPSGAEIATATSATDCGTTHTRQMCR